MWFGFGAASACDKVQSGVAVFVGGVDIGSGVYEQLHRVDGGAVGFVASKAVCECMQRCLAFGVAQLGVGIGFEQASGQIGI